MLSSTQTLRTVNHWLHVPPTHSLGICALGAAGHRVGAEAWVRAPPGDPSLLCRNTSSVVCMDYADSLQ